MALSEEDRAEVQRMVVASAQAVLNNANRFGLTWRRIPATVVNGSDPAAVIIVLDGDEEANTVVAISLNGGAVTGSRVMVDIVPPSGMYIIGVAPGDQNPSYRFIDRVLITATETLDPGDYLGIQLLDVEIVGGGGAGGGAAITGASQVTLGGAGGAGGYSRKLIRAGDMNWSTPATIGAGGIGASAADGGTGGTTSFQGMSATGGVGGEALAVGGAFANVTGGVGGAGSGGDINIRGSDGGNAIRVPTGLIGCIPSGAASGLYGNSVRPAGTDAGANGNAARVYGNGGGGAHNTASQGTDKTGGDGSAGVVQLTLYA